MSAKKFEGKVISAKMKDTCVVAVDMPKKHSIYFKAIKNTTKFKARNLVGAKSGDLVIITETRPMSKDVHFVVTSIKES